MCGNSDWLQRKAIVFIWCLYSDFPQKEKNFPKKRSNKSRQGLSFPGRFILSSKIQQNETDIVISENIQGCFPAKSHGWWRSSLHFLTSVMLCEKSSLPFHQELDCSCGYSVAVNRIESFLLGDWEGKDDWWKEFYFHITITLWINSFILRNSFVLHLICLIILSPQKIYLFVSYVVTLS